MGRKLKTKIVDATASLDLIVQRFMDMKYIGVINIPDGDNVIRLEYTKKAKKEFFYLQNKSITAYHERIKSLMAKYEMAVYDNTPINFPRIERMVMYTCYFVDEIKDDYYSLLNFRKSMYQANYSFVFAIKEKKILVFKPHLLFNKKLKTLNKFIEEVFNE